MMKRIIFLAALVFATPVMVFPKSQPTAAQQQEQMLSKFKYKYKFVNEYTTAVPLTITVKFEDGNQAVGQIKDDNPLTFPSNYCITYFKIEGQKETAKFEGGHSYLEWEDISTSHVKTLCGTRTITIVPLDDDPYIQARW